MSSDLITPSANKEIKSILPHNEIWNDAIFSYCFSKEEYEQCKEQGLKRHNTKTEFIRYYRKPYQGTAYDGYSHVKGRLGEYIYEIWSGLKGNEEYYATHGDTGDYGENGEIEIKTSTYVKNLDITLKVETQKYEKVFNKNNTKVLMLNRLKDGYVLGKDYCIVEIVGWTSVERFKIFAEEESYGIHKHTNYVNRINELIKVLPDGKHNELLKMAHKDNQNILKLRKELNLSGVTEILEQNILLKNILGS